MKDYEIDVYNTSIVVSNYKLGDCKSLEANFKVRVPITQHYTQYRLFGIYYDEENSKLYLPRGIDIWYVENMLGVKATIHRGTHYKYDTHQDFMVKRLPRDEVQQQALRFMIGYAEYSSTKSKTQLCLNLNTGKGKTYVSIGTIAYLRMKALIIMYSKQLINQWKKEIMDITNLTDKQIVIIDGSIGIKRALRGYFSEGIIFLVTHGTLESYANSNGWEAVGEFVKSLKVGIKIFDEAHQNFENLMMIDYFTNVYKNYYLTATALRSNDDEDKIYQLSFKNVPFIDLFDPEEDPHTRYTAIKFYSNPTPVEQSSCKNQYGLDRNKYTDYLVNKPKFYDILRIIMDIVLRRTENGGKCLLYIGTNYAIQKVYNWIISNYYWLSDDIGILSTLVSNEEREENKEKRILLATTKSAGTGMDIKGLILTIVLAEPFKSEVLARQTLGRTRASDTEYIELVDMSFPQCRKYYTHKKPVFLKYATDCREMVMKDDYILDKIIELGEKDKQYFLNRIYCQSWNVRGMTYDGRLIPGIIYDNTLRKGMIYEN